MTVSYSTKQTAAIMRKTLRARWPGVKFSVRQGRGTGSAWIGVSWTDGPRETEVKTVVDGFRSASFNGMTDSYDTLPDQLVAINPTELPEMVRYGCDGVNVERHYSPDAVQHVTRELLADNEHLRELLAAIDIDTLDYNRLHSGQFCLLALPEDRGLTHRGEHIPTYRINDAGTAITAALRLTDLTTHTTA
ncbi:LPD29 domain-containing protein [Gordonia lacunae]|uniref:LPD29 domain-containing protein n=1 Tax=Gordonia TaxID=2053 RepID=UPI00200B64FB|nr:LPD29 domain-containing protein [Gordonia terrae]UPW12034.1 hypothetical protein M1C59_25640 [Gordonia terrae]